MVRKALANAMPSGRKNQERMLPKLGPVKESIDNILEMDTQAPRKQRHTALLIWRRICAEQTEYSVANSTVWEYVCGRKQAMGLGQREVFVPQSYTAGQNYVEFRVMVRNGGDLRLLGQKLRHSSASLIHNFLQGFEPFQEARR